MTAAIEPRAKLAALTGIRGIAAWLVVLFHIRTGLRAELPAPLLSVFDRGYLAVDLFFMLSGFVLWLNYAERLRSRGLSAAPMFLARRLARIWPLHIVILLATIFLAAARELAGAANRIQYPWSELPLHVLLAQNWGFTRSLTWNDPAWSISCEFAAYLLFPLLVMTVDWRRLPTRALLILLVLLATSLHLLMASHGASNLGADIPRFGLARALIEFTMGTILCTLWDRQRNAPRLAMPLCFAVLALLGIAVGAGLVPETLAVPLLFALLLLGVSLSAEGPANPLSWRFIHYLGEISYATYLVHFLLYILFKLLFVTDADHVPLPLVGLFLLLVLAASVVLHHGVERPAQRAINRLIDARGRLRPATEGA